MTSYPIYSYGHDYGNSKTCGVTRINGQTYALTIPSALLPGSYETLKAKVSSTNMGVGLGSILTQQSHVIELDGDHWYVGNLAIDQAPASYSIADLTSRGDISRYWSKRNLAMLLATSGTLINDIEYGLAVVANLPIGTHTETNTRAVKAALDGDYEFKLDGIKRIAHVVVKKTVMEGAGASIAFAPPGQKKLAVGDIGGRTFDAYVVSGQVPVDGMCKSLDVGVETAFDAVATAFEATFQYPLSAGDARAIQACYVGNKDYLSVPTVANAEVDPQVLEKLIDKILRDVGGQIVAFLKRTWSSSLASDVLLSDIPTILLIGGGAYYFEKDLRPLFKKRLVVPAHPEYANATGYEKLAFHYLQKEWAARSNVS